MPERIVVAMSGGVDSSVAAALLVEEGHEVVGVGLRLADPAPSASFHRGCCAPRDLADARAVAAKLDIPFYVLDVRESFRETVIENFIEEYARGRTPVPCVACNQVVKFDYLAGKAKGFGADQPHVSPDGRWLAYITTESGRYEVYVEPFRRRGEKVRVSTGGGGQPRWRGDGKELFFLSPDGSLMAVDVEEGATGPEVGIPTTLVPARDLEATVQGPDYHDYAVSADGQRFLVKKSAESDGRRRIHVLLDWPSLL